MKIGTKSILFGAHQFLIHPIILFIAWWKLYGFPWDIRLWFAFVLHDIGYWGSPNMDGPEGELHPYVGARIMHRLFDKGNSSYWFDFCLYHSRFLAKQHGKQYSKLCVADKYAIVLEPWWLYLPRVNMSGEIHEYLKEASDGKYEHMFISTKSQKVWFKNMVDYLRDWVMEHKEIKEDTWTRV